MKLPDPDQKPSARNYTRSNDSTMQSPQSTNGARLARRSFSGDWVKQLLHIMPTRDKRLFGGCIAVFLLSCLGVVIGGYHALTTEVPRSGGTYTEAVVGRPRLINPIYAEQNTVDRDLSELMYAGLVSVGDAEIVPDLAREWSISEDQKTYTFYLRDGITWPDDQPFTANDVAFTIETIKDKAYQSPLYSSFNTVEIVVLDDHTIEFTLPEPYTPFLESMTVGMLPEHIWSNITPESVGLTDFNIQPLGLGAYQFKQLTKTKYGTVHQYTMERNNEYHRGKPHIKEITFVFFDTFDDARDAFERGEVDGMNFVSPSQSTDVKRKDSIAHELELPQYTALFFNMSSSSPITNSSVRKALAYAIQKDLIIDAVLNGKGQVVHGPVLPGYPGYNPNIEQYAYDPNHAKELLDTAGWTEGSDFMRHDADGNNLTITITTANTPELIQVAERIASFWQTIGVQTTIDAQDISTLQTESIRGRTYDVLLFGEIIGFDPDPYPFWHSSQISASGFNLSNFKNADADTVLTEARKTADQDIKAQKYIHFQNILVAEMPAIFLYTPHYTYPVSKHITVVAPQHIIHPAHRFATIHEWYIKTKRVFK